MPIGSAMLTGVTIGLFAGLKEAAAVMVQEVETFTPRPGMHEQYMRIYDRYKNVYHAVRPLM